MNTKLVNGAVGAGLVIVVTCGVVLNSASDRADSNAKSDSGANRPAVSLMGGSSGGTTKVLRERGAERANAPLAVPIVKNEAPAEESSVVSQVAFVEPVVTEEKMTWEPADEESYASAQLRVSGPGIEPFETTFASGEPIAFPFSSDDGTAWSDGLYHWEITSAPVVSDEARAMMAEVRELVTSNDAEEVLRYNGVNIQPGLTQSGSFRILDGKPVTEVEEAISLVAEEAPIELAANGSVAADVDSEEGVQLRAQVFVTDLVVQGSGCVGFDCATSENFGFDTIRLKENNLRLHFNDTSTSASFPSNDWRLIANDSSNGGGNYFAIEDATAGRQSFRVDAGAPANSIRILNSGNIGIGTSNPNVELHVVDGDSPTLRLEQDGSSGFTPQTWDVAGNETNFFVRDATNGSRLPFKIRPSAPTNSLYVDTDGDVGLGTASPAAALHIEQGDLRVEGGIQVEFDQSNGSAPGISVVDTSAVGGGTDFIVTADGSVGVGTGSPQRKVHVSDSDNVYMALAREGGATDSALLFGAESGLNRIYSWTSAAGAVPSPFRISIGVATAMHIDTNANVGIGTTVPGAKLHVAGDILATGTVTGSSDRNLKEAFQDVDVRKVLEQVVELPIQKWNYKRDKGVIRHIGPVAQDFHQAFGVGRDDVTISMVDADGVALAAIQGLHQVVDEKDVEIQTLREKTEAMEAQLKLLMRAFAEKPQDVSLPVSAAE